MNDLPHKKSIKMNIQYIYIYLKTYSEQKLNYINTNITFKIVTTLNIICNILYNIFRNISLYNSF